MGRVKNGKDAGAENIAVPPGKVIPCQMTARNATWKRVVFQACPGAGVCPLFPGHAGVLEGELERYLKLFRKL
jgi:hypothetical protein